MHIHENTEELNALKKDTIAFFKVIEFYEKFQSKCIEAINHAQDKAKEIDDNSSKIWNQLGDSLWQTLPKIDKEVNLILKDHELNSPKDCPKLKDMDSFQKHFNTLLLHLALAIKITNKVLEDQNLELNNTLPCHPIEMINQELQKYD